MQDSNTVYSMVRSAPRASQPPQPSAFAELDRYIVLAGADAGYDEADETEDDLSGAKSKMRRRRRVSRRFKRAGSKGRGGRQAVLAYRVAARAAKWEGKKLHRLRGRAAARKAMKTAKNVREAVKKGLLAAGLSPADAQRYSAIGIAIARKGGDEKGVKALLAKMRKTRAARTARKPGESIAKRVKYAKRKALPAVSSQAETDVEDEATGEFEPSGESEGASFDEEDEAELKGGLAGFGMSFDAIKPYFPWMALAAGVTVILLSNNRKRSK